MVLKCPCKGCENRTITCHGVCRKYEEWKIYNEDRKKWLKDQSQYVNEGAVKGGLKNIKERARGWGKRRVKNYD